MQCRAQKAWRRQVVYPVVVVCFVVSAVLGGCGTSNAVEDGGSSLPWHVQSVDGPRRITISGSVPYCAGLPKPTISEVVTRYDGERVFIDVRVDVPDALPDHTGLCRGSRLILTEMVSLTQGVERSVLFDASEDPPAQRWPEL